MTYTDQETKETYQVIDCKDCDGSGLAEWHLGCGDSGPPDCRKCDGIGQYSINSIQNARLTIIGGVPLYPPTPPLINS